MNKATTGFILSTWDNNNVMYYAGAGMMTDELSLACVFHVEECAMIEAEEQGRNLYRGTDHKIESLTVIKLSQL